jgi:hypothetical protein
MPNSADRLVCAMGHTRIGLNAKQQEGLCVVHASEVGLVYISRTHGIMKSRLMESVTGLKLDFIMQVTDGNSRTNRQIRYVSNGDLLSTQLSQH